MTFGILCKAPEDDPFTAWTADQPEVLNGWHWWGSKMDRHMTLEAAQLRIRGYRGSPWRYQIVRTS